MNSYKINNSYTVYINWAYINEAKKVCEQQKKMNATRGTRVYRSYSDKELPAGTVVNNKHYGHGTVVSTDKNGVMYVAFASKTVKFMYPDALYQGYLRKVR